VLAVLAACSIWATSWMIRVLTDDADAGFLGAAVLALTPGFILFFPGFDAAYPILTCAMVGLWARAVQTGRWSYAAAFGAVLALATFFTYVLLVLGIFLLGYALWGLKGVPGWTWKALIRQSSVALAVLAGIYLTLWLVTGFDVIATFREALRLQASIMNWITTGRRAWPRTIGFDLWDFALGAGWIPVLIAGYGLVGYRQRGRTERAAMGLAVLQIVGVALTGLVASETARVWIFMQPLLMIPVGLELRRWDAGARVATVIAMAILLTIMCGRLELIATEPLDKLPEWLVAGR
jgi:hypothetical protein